MASTSFQNVSHGEYDVFLSFRGEDTRKGFIGHLYTALNNKGIYLFRDDKQLEKGGSISPNLLKAIEESRISIIVLSKNYASSTWCLDELLKIVECKNREDQIFPIFYEVEPTVVRKQTASFGEAFAKHEEFFRNNIEKVQKWRHALKVVANISGWELKDRNESGFIEEIVNVISSKIRSEPEILKELVGMESRLEKLRFLMGTGSNDVRMIGIWGMGGLGKTTLARVVYDLMSHEFDGSSFLADVREKFEKEGSEISLQKQLLSDLLKLSDYSTQNVYDGIKIIGSRLRRKKVLLIIDDVADVEQLQGLVGRRDWFGPGSKILITTRDRQLLVAHEVDEEHILDLHVLNNDEALQLFSMKAFKSHQPMGEYVELSKRVLEYARGLPLALKVLGSFLIGRSADLWRSALERLKKDPSNKIMSILQISFEGLQDSEKKIFLDVACFFKWKNRDYVTKILEGCGFSPVIGIEVLIEKSLLTVDGCNILHMHDLLRELGQLIVTRQSAEEPGKRSRIWREEEVRQVLTNNTGGEVVEGIIVNAYFPENEVYLSASAKAFSQMTNLRLLKISNVQLPRGLEYLSNRLRLLDWHRYPLKSLPSNLQLDKIVEFKMCYSRIEELWKGFKPLNMLRVMKLSHSENLIKTPDFTKVPNLEVLDLEGCTRLREIHQSLLRHNKLILLNLKGCTSLTTLPGEIFMKSLKTLVLSGCLKLRKLPRVVGSMECLRELLLDETDIKELPLSIKLLSKLVLLNLKDCRNLETLPITASSLKCLGTLTLSGCSKIVKFPESVINMEDLSELFLDGTSITEVPSSIELLTRLELLNLNDCRSLTTLPGEIFMESLKTLVLSGCSKLKKFPDVVGGMECLQELRLDGTDIKELPLSIELLSKLVLLDLNNCKNLKSLPRNIIGLKYLSTLNLSGTSKFREFPEITGRMEHLSDLNLEGTAIRELPVSIELLSGLVSLNLKDCRNLETLPITVSSLKCLRTLKLSGCSKLVKFPEIMRSMGDLTELLLDGTSIAEVPSSIELLTRLELLNLKDCRNLASLPITIGSLECLQTLVLSGCSKIVKLPETVISVEDLSELFLDGTSITEVPSSIELLTKLKWLNLNDCRSLVSLPSSINGLKSLKTLNLSGCIKLENVPETLGQVESLEELDISGTAIRQPQSSIFLMKNLRELSCRGCKGSPSSASWFLRFPINLMRWSSDPVALSLPSSLSGLCSLTKLDISDCNLGEGAIPSSIGDLCSLKQLYLSRNNFVSLPASIYRLSNLWLIELEECKMLQTLPQLPDGTQHILLGGCVSLETLSDVLKLNEHQLQSLFLHCVECLKLAGNNDVALSLLKGYIKNSENMLLSDKYIKQSKVSLAFFSIVVPGSEIPEWFEYQNNEGSSITISTPPKTYKNSKLVGYAMCCVFHVPKYSLPYYHPKFPYPVHVLSINSKPKYSGLSGIFIRKQFGQAMSDHLFLYYQKRERISKVEFDSPSGLELKRCGVHPIYVHQGDKFNQTSDPVWNLNEFGHDCAESTSFTRGRNDDLDRAEAGGSCCRDC